jgi:hypothetical protein
VQRALLEAAKNHPEVLIKPPPEVWFQGFGDSSLDFDLLVWTGEPKKQFKVKSDLYYCIEASLRHYKIEIPFPQRDLHVRSPHLEQFVSAMGDYTAIRSQSSLPNGASPRINSANLPAGVLASESSLATVPRIQDGVESIDLEAIATELRTPDGLNIQDRRYRGNLYPACFTGSDLVEWLVQSRHVSRAEAIVIGQRLVDHRIIHHVLDDAPFQDGYVFYRFYHDDA